MADDKVYAWARGLTLKTIQHLKERGLYRPEGPGITEVKPGVWVHPNYVSRIKKDNGTHREPGDES